MVRALAATVAGLALAALLAGCGGSDRGAYVKANERLFRELRVFPGTRLLEKTSTPYRNGESGPVVGYGTRYDLRLPAAATATTVAAFYLRKLRPGWRLVERIGGPVLNFRRGDAFVSINLEGASYHVLEVAVDHAFYATLKR